MHADTFLRFARVGLVALLLPAASRAQDRYAVGDIVADAVLIDRSTGQPVNLRSLEGKVILLEWFAWWCPFCQAAAAQLGPAIAGLYGGKGNAHGVPVVHVLLNLQGGQESQTQGFLNAYGASSVTVLEDFSRSLASRFQAGGQPIFAVINGVANSPSHAQWELVYSRLGYGQTQFPVADFSTVIDSVEAAPAPLAPAFTTQPQDGSAGVGGNLTLAVAAGGSPPPAWQWRRNGADLPGATAASLGLGNLQPGDAGIYTVVATNSAGSQTSRAAIVGVNTTSKVIGSGEALEPVDILHPNGRVFDQVLVTGAAETITADPGQTTRTSYIDLDHDIVQVEFSGPGALSLVLADASAPSPPVNYNQAVDYVKGHAGIVIVGADENTNVSVFTVGRATAFDPSGNFDILLPISPTNQPANHGGQLFQGRDATTYDGIADIAFIAIASTNGKFGGVRTSNANYFAAKGLTGIYAPGVAFQGPVFVGNLSAFDAATPVILLGSVNDARITGGDLWQANGAAVQVSGIAQLKFTAGGDSHGKTLQAQSNRAVLKQDGSDVTAAIVEAPSP